MKKEDSYQDIYEDIYSSTFEDLEFYRDSSQRLLKEVFRLRKKVRELEKLLESKGDVPKDLKDLAAYESGF